MDKTQEILSFIPETTLSKAKFAELPFAVRAGVSLVTDEPRQLRKIVQTMWRFNAWCDPEPIPSGLSEDELLEFLKMPPWCPQLTQRIDYIFAKTLTEQERVVIRAHMEQGISFKELEVILEARSNQLSAIERTAFRRLRPWAANYLAQPPCTCSITEIATNDPVALADLSLIELDLDMSVLQILFQNTFRTVSDLVRQFYEPGLSALSGLIEAGLTQEQAEILRDYLLDNHIMAEDRLLKRDRRDIVPLELEDNIKEIVYNYDEYNFFMGNQIETIDQFINPPAFMWRHPDAPHLAVGEATREDLKERCQVFRHMNPSRFSIKWWPRLVEYELVCCS